MSLVKQSVRCCRAALTIVTIACDGTGPSADEVQMNAVWADAAWLGGAEVLTFEDSLLLISWTPATRLEAPSITMRAVVPNHGTGVYQIGENAAAVQYLLGGDVLTASYVMTADLNGTLTIDEITSQQIRGSVEFEAASAGGTQPVGPQARFHGTFTAPPRSPYLR